MKKEMIKKRKNEKEMSKKEIMDVVFLLDRSG